ncbi:molybdate transporter 1 [Forsythia ovata]|uniref:Molybdate transporter 1 n=1 Tax=Forsythia ovata TaxID=205694 RepID=A0ABD1RLR3_9LAMI
MAELILNDPIPDATPCCHGAGGIAGQYKFGGMSGWCVALLDVAKLVLGLDSSLVKILDQFSVGVLGVLLLFVGIELAMCSRDMNSKEESRVRQAFLERTGVYIVEGDINNVALLNKLFDIVPFTHVMHLAGVRYAMDGHLLHIQHRPIELDID